MRVAVVDIGTNSTRLLVADVGPDGARRPSSTGARPSRASARASTPPACSPTRRWSASSRRSPATARRSTHHGAEATTAVLTSRGARRDQRRAVHRSASRDDFGLDAETITGDEEARLTFLGATSERAARRRRPSSSSTSAAARPSSSSAPTGVEPTSSPPRPASCATPSATCTTTRRTPDELQALGDDVARDLRRGAARRGARAGRGRHRRRRHRDVVRGDRPGARSLRPRTVHGYRLTLAECELLLARLAQMANDERREVAGLHPDRAPTIVAGVALLIEAMRTFGLDEVEVSEHDILRGAALEPRRLSALRTDLVVAPEASEAAHEERLPKLATQDGQGYVPCCGRIYVARSREAPIRCGFTWPMCAGGRVRPFGARPSSDTSIIGTGACIHNRTSVHHTPTCGDAHRSCEVASHEYGEMFRTATHGHGTVGPEHDPDSRGGDLLMDEVDEMLAISAQLDDDPSPRSEPRSRARRPRARLGCRPPVQRPMSRRRSDDDESVLDPAILAGLVHV